MRERRNHNVPEQIDLWQVEPVKGSEPKISLSTQSRRSETTAEKELVDYRQALENLGRLPDAAYADIVLSGSAKKHNQRAVPVRIRYREYRNAERAVTNRSVVIELKDDGRDFSGEVAVNEKGELALVTKWAEADMPRGEIKNLMLRAASRLLKKTSDIAAPEKQSEAETENQPRIPVEQPVRTPEYSLRSIGDFTRVEFDGKGFEVEPLGTGVYQIRYVPKGQVLEYVGTFTENGNGQLHMKGSSVALKPGQRAVDITGETAELMRQALDYYLDYQQKQGLEKNN